jgi:hypothetical protein
MKAQILKIAGVKSEKEFYKKYPSEEAFMKQHGKAFKKAQFGTYIGGDTNAAPKMISFSDSYNDSDKMVTGSTDEERQKRQLAIQQAAASQPKGGGGGGMDMGSMMGMMGGEGEEGGSGGGMDGIMSMFGGEGGGGEGGGGFMEMLGGMFGGGAKYGTSIPKAQGGQTLGAVPEWYQNNQTGFQTNYQQPQQPQQTYAGPQQQPVQGVQSNLQPAGLAKTPQQPGPSAPMPTEQDLRGAPQEDKGLSSKLGGLTKMMGPLGGIIEGIDALKEEQEAVKRAEQMKQLSALTLKASTTRPEQKERKYVRPEDVANTGEAFFPVYGVGTNVLARNGLRLQSGGSIGGNPTEIQNTYGDGNSIYDDLEYSPLIDENQQKSFYYGGGIPKAQNGMDRWSNSMNGGGSGFSGAGEGGSPWGAISTQATGIGQGMMGGQNAGGKIGGTAGKAIGSIWGPVGGAIGEFAGGMIGNAVDTNAKDIKKKNEATQKNIQNQAYNQMAPGIQAGYASHLRDGGYLNPEYNPQVIAMFGDHNADDFADYAHKFRAGGHLKEYTAPSERAMQTYRNGGGVKSYGLGGELETHWGGGAETISYNPYLPGSGETVMFRGKSHEERSPNGETGIGVTYGGNPVEVERGEPMVELEEGGQLDPQTGEAQKSGVVFGNLQIPDQYIDLLGDKNAKGKKFKNYVNDLSKSEAKYNKSIEKSTNELNALDVSSSFDRLKLSSLQANINGSNMKLKDIADKKIKAADLQNAINDTAEENGLVADDLARGKIKIDEKAMETREARWGDAIRKAADGATTTTEKTTAKPTEFTSTKAAKAAGFVQDANGNWYKPKEGKKKTVTEKKSASAMDYIPKQSADKETGLYGGVTPEQFKAYKEKNKWYDWTGFDPKKQEDVDKYRQAFNIESEKRGSKARMLSDEIDPKTKLPKENGKTKWVGKQFVSANIEDVKEEEPGYDAQEVATVNEVPTTPVPYKRNKWIDYGNQALEYLRPSDQEPFDYNQLMGEMYAMSSNQLDPVQAQLYKPEIGVPYDISYQDQLNENQADYNAAQRMMGYNPAALANLNAQKYQANSKVLAEQFRANQAMKDQVYTGNRNTLNQAKLANLGILDKQYERQAEALSNTKATAQAAINSISDKMAKNKLENRTLGIYENLYKYRYDNKGRAINMNPLFQANIPEVGTGKVTQEQVPVLDDKGNIVRYQLRVRTPEEIAAAELENNPQALPSLATPGINPNVQTKTKKNSRNGSIVKAIKNL